jgi:hypothetical protein
VITEKQPTHENLPNPAAKVEGDGMDAHVEAGTSIAASIEAASSSKTTKDTKSSNLTSPDD